MITVEAGKTREIYVKYGDQENQRVGAQDVTVTGLTFDSGEATVSIQPSANGATLKFTNTGTVDAVVKTCVVQGTKITDFGEIEAKAVDSASIIKYGRRSLRLNLPSMDNLPGAQYIADFERDRRGQPRGMVKSITLASHGKNGGGNHPQQLARTLGDLIAIQETQTGHSKNYYIIGEAHELSFSATLFKTTWYLEPAPDVYPWKLDTVGRSELDMATRLTY